MKKITHEDIIELKIKPIDCLNWIQEALTLKEECILPAKSSIKPCGDVFFTSMPCMIPELDIYGLKMVSRIPSQKPALNSTILLFRVSTGELLSIMDCNWITAMRTGAVATLSIQKASKENFKRIGCIGLGNTCIATLDILLKTVNRDITLLLKKYKEDHTRIINRYKSYTNVTIELVETDKDLILNSEIILSCVTSVAGNFGEDSWYKEGITVVPIHTMGFQNCDLFFDKVIIDDYEHVKGFKYFDKFKNTINLQDLPTLSTIRSSNTERIIAYNVGIALHDVYFAYKIFQLLENKPSDGGLNSLKDKIWL